MPAFRSDSVAAEIVGQEVDQIGAMLRIADESLQCSRGSARG
jgi:hypothetical protein